MNDQLPEMQDSVEVELITCELVQKAKHPVEVYRWMVEELFIELNRININPSEAMLVNCFDYFEEQPNSINLFSTEK
jgi:hypothetical protein